MRRTMLVIGLAAIAGCAGVSKEQYQAKEAEVTKYKQAAQQQDAKLNELQQKVATLEQQNEAMHASLQRQAKESTAAKTELQQEKPLKVSQSVLFKENSSKITPEGRRALDSIGDALAGKKDKAVIVSGFTDSTEGGGKDRTAKRWQLSSARALEVAKYIAGRGVDPSLIAVAGFGQARPVAPNDTLASKALNRRVEIMLSPANQEVLTIDLKPAELEKSGTGSGQGQQ